MTTASCLQKSVMTLADNQLYIAYAISILKAKPISVSLDDYFSALKGALTPDDHMHTSVLETGKLWQQLFKKAESTWQLNACKSIFQSGTTNTPSAVKDSKSSSQKRKFKEVGVVESQNVKRQKPTQTNTISQPSPIDKLNSSRQKVMNVVVKLQRLHATPSTTSELLACFEQACSTVISCISDAKSTFRTRNGQIQDRPTLQEACHAAKTVISASFTILEGMASATEGRNSSMSISPFVSLTKDLLAHLHRLSSREAQSQSNRRETRSSASNQSRTLFEHDAGCLSQFLSHLLSRSLSLGLELFSVYLQHLGSCMSFLLLDECTADDNEDLEHQTSSLSFEQNMPKTTRKTSVQLQAPFIISILETVMNGKDISMDNDKMAKNIVSYLQRTLSQAVFGQDDTSLRMHAEMNTLNKFLRSSSEQSKLNTSTDLYKAVWNMLGWDTLMTDTV